MSSDSELSAILESSNDDIGSISAALSCRGRSAGSFPEQRLVIEPNDDKDIDVVYSQYAAYCIAISWSSPQHYIIRTFWPHDLKTILRAKFAQFSGVITSAIFFKHGSNFRIVSLKCRTFKILKN